MNHLEEQRVLSKSRVDTINSLQDRLNVLRRELQNATAASTDGKAAQINQNLKHDAISVRPAAGSPERIRNSCRDAKRQLIASERDGVGRRSGSRRPNSSLTAASGITRSPRASGLRIASCDVGRRYRCSGAESANISKRIEDCVERVRPPCCWNGANARFTTREAVQSIPR